MIKQWDVLIEQSAMFLREVPVVIAKPHGALDTFPRLRHPLVPPAKAQQALLSVVAYPHVLSVVPLASRANALPPPHRQWPMNLLLRQALSQTQHLILGAGTGEPLTLLGAHLILLNIHP